MKRKIVLRYIVGLAFFCLIAFGIGGFINQVAQAEDGPIPVNPPGTGPGIESTWVPPESNVGPDGLVLSNEIPEIRTGSETIHPSGIIGLSPDQDVPVRTSSTILEQPQGLFSPGDGLAPETDKELDVSESVQVDLQPVSNEISVVPPHIGRGFLQNTITSTISSTVSYIDAPVLNTNPAGLFISTVVLDPLNSNTPYHDHPLGAFYSSPDVRWSIFNEDYQPMVSGPTFNIFYPDLSATKFVHTATAANVSMDLTRIDHAATNSNPGAYVFALPVYNPGGTQSGAGWYSHRIGVYFDPYEQKWGIYNEDHQSILPSNENAAFFVYVANPSVDVVYRHISTTGNVSANYTTLDHPMLNGNPNAVVFVQHIWTNSYIDETFGVWYNQGTKRWTIYNNTFANMAVNQTFNVLIIPNRSDTFVYKATADRILGEPNLHVLRIDHPYLNDNPNAQVFAIHNWNPLGDDNKIIDPHPIGVIYYSGHWNIYHTDFQPILLNSTFNVYFTNPQLNSYSTGVKSFNTTGSVLNLNFPTLNNKTSSIFLEMQNYTPGEGASGTTYGFESTVSYASGIWSIKRAAGPDYPLNTAFNVLIPTRNMFIHITTPESYPGTYTAGTCFDHPLLNDRPGAIVFVTANDTPNGSAAPIDNNQLGVYYQINFHKWCVYHENVVTIPLGTAFNVFIGDTKVFLPLIKR